MYVCCMLTNRNIQRHRQKCAALRRRNDFETARIQKKYINAKQKVEYVRILSMICDIIVAVALAMAYEEFMVCLFFF